MRVRTLPKWFRLIVFVLLLAAIQGCSPGKGLSANYDLAEYLFPERSGTLVYRRFLSEKPEDTNNFTEPEYQKDVQYTTILDGMLITVHSDDDTDRTYTLSDTIIDVVESEDDLSYRFQRLADSQTNFVVESVIKETEESGSTSLITYECNITGFASTMTIESNPQVYEDVLHVVCVQQHSVSTILDGKKITSLTERREENDYAKKVGLIRTEKTWCDAVVIDDDHRSDAGCSRILDEIVTFVAD